MWSPLTQVRGWRGDQLMLQAGGGVVWKVDGCLLVLGEPPKYWGRAPIKWVHVPPF